MPFTIAMQAPLRERAERDNLELWAELRRQFPLTDFPLDHDLIAREVARVPREEVLNRWAQLELHGDEGLGSPIVTIRLTCAFIELVSTPAESCAARLSRVRPLLEFFRNRGFSVPEWPELLGEYERQRGRTEFVARAIGGRTPTT